MDIYPGTLLAGSLQADVLEENDLASADPEILELYASSGFNPLSNRCHRVGDVFFSPLHSRSSLSTSQCQALQRGFQPSIPFLNAEEITQLIKTYVTIRQPEWYLESMAKLTARQFDWIPAGGSLDCVPTALISTVVQSQTPLLRPIADLVAGYAKNADLPERQ